MTITVELQAYLMQYAPDGKPSFSYHLPEGAKVWDLIRNLNIPDELASVIIVGNTSVDYQHPLTNGDHVTIIPPLAGGKGP